jgi:hypothetical protein
MEQNLAEGAIDATLVFLKHIEAMGEKVPVWISENQPKLGQVGEYGWITPEDIKKLKPAQLGAKVRTPRDTDLPVRIQAFLQATADRRGPGTPALDDDTGREMLLGLESPDDIQRKIDKQNVRQRMMDSGFIDKKVQELLNVSLVKEGTPNVSPDQAAQADPALQQATQQLNGPGGEAEMNGGVAPNLLSSQMQGRQMSGTPMMPPQAPAPSPAAPPQLLSTPQRPTPGGVRPRNGMGGGLAPGGAQPSQTQGRGAQLLRGGP